MHRSEHFHREGTERVESELPSATGVRDEATVSVDERTKMFVVRNNVEPFGAGSGGERDARRAGFRLRRCCAKRPMRDS